MASLPVVAILPLGTVKHVGKTFAFTAKEKNFIAMHVKSERIARNVVPTI